MSSLSLSLLVLHRLHSGGCSSGRHQKSQRPPSLCYWRDTRTTNELWVSTSKLPLLHAILCVFCCRLIFLGETFNGFISVHNDSQDIAKGVAVKVHHLDSHTTYCGGFSYCVFPGGVTDTISPPSPPVRPPDPPARPLCL